MIRRFLKWALRTRSQIGEWYTSLRVENVKGRYFRNGYWFKPLYGPYGNYPQAFTASQMPDSYLRLTFSPESKLIDFKKVRR
jgi:hypothetical protein